MRHGIKSWDKPVAEGGTYALILSIREPCTLRIGKLGVYNFRPGFYVYAGSALGGLSSRINRHLRAEKRLHWHIDYLLQKAGIEEIWYDRGSERLECTWYGIIATLPGALPYICGFGSTDCRCTGHLIFFAAEPTFEAFSRKCKEERLPQPFLL